MKIQFSLAPFFFLTISAWAAVAPDFLVGQQPTLPGVTVTASPPEAHHFNINAPVTLEVSGSSKPQKPASKAPQKLEFLIKKSESLTGFRVTAYLCDDAKTYCEKHQVVVGDFIEKKAPDKKLNADQKHSMRDGFLLNDPAEAFRRAREGHKNVLIDFFGIWCPPCNLLDEKVFPSQEFRAATKDFVKIRMDVDSSVSWELKAKYKVDGYPTVVVTDSDGIELRRIVGYRPKTEFMQVISGNSPSIDRGPKAGLIEEFNRDLSAESYQAAIAVSETMLEGAKPGVPVDPSSDLTREDILETRGDLFRKLGKIGLSRLAFRDAAESYEDLMHESRDESRGYALELGYCLGMAGKVSRADRLYERFERKYPHEFTFYFGHARMKLGIKDFASAERLAAKALRFSYGDNRLRTISVLAEAEIAQGKKQDALKVLREALGTAEIPVEKNVRTHRYIKTLRDLEAKISN